MKNSIIALWTAIVLAFVEFILSVICENLLCFIQYVTGYHYIYLGHPGYHIVFDNIIVLVARFYYGFILVVALALFLCRFSGWHIHWSIIGLINVSIILIMFGIYDQSLGLHKSMFNWQALWYQNVYSIPVVIALFSPWLVSKLPFWTVLPDITGNRVQKK